MASGEIATPRGWKPTFTLPAGLSCDCETSKRSARRSSWRRRAPGCRRQTTRRPRGARRRPLRPRPCLRPHRPTPACPSLVQHQQPRLIRREQHVDRRRIRHGRLGRSAGHVHRAIGRLRRQTRTGLATSAHTKPSAGFASLSSAKRRVGNVRSGSAPLAGDSYASPGRRSREAQTWSTCSAS